MKIAENRLTVSLVLLVVGLGLLAAGGFVSFDDRGGPDWLFPLGPLAMIPGVAALIVAWPEPKARLWLGVAFCVLTLFIIWQHFVNVSFRFIWAGSEGELFFFEAFLILLTSVLLASGGVALGRRRWLLRIPAYLIGFVVLTFTLALIGAAAFGSTCTGEEEEGCMAAAGGLFVGGALGVLASPVLIVVIELILLVRRRRKAAEAGGR